MENNNELEQMRQEIISLREKLDHQIIINEEHVRRTMQDKVKNIKLQTAILAAIGIAGTVFCHWAISSYIGLSLALSVTTDIFLIAAVVLSVWSTRKLHPRDMMNENLVKAGKEIAKMKKRGIVWKKIAFPFLAVWFTWVVIETVNAGLDNDMVTGFLGGCGLGLLGGIVCGAIYDRKQTAKIDGLLKQIDELLK